MPDDTLRLVARVEDQFTGPLARLSGALKRVGDTDTAETYNTLRNMNIGEVVEKMISAKSMDEKLKLAFEALQNISEPEVRRRVSRLFFGTDDVGRVAASVAKGTFELILNDIQRNSGEITKEMEAQAQKFEGSLSKLRQSAEKGKVEILGPLLDGVNTVIEWGEKGDVIGHAATALRRKLLGDTAASGAPAKATPPGFLSRGITDREAPEERRGRLTGRLEKLDAEPRDQDYARKRDRLTEELKRVADELARLREQGPVVQQQSLSSQAGGGALIQRAALGGGFGFGGGSGFGGGGAMGGGGYVDAAAHRAAPAVPWEVALVRSTARAPPLHAARASAPAAAARPAI